MILQEHFTAIILAAGASSRMGRPKQLLEVNGTCMLDHAIQAALSAGIISPIVVLGANAKLIESYSTLLNQCTVVLNKKHDLGLSTSLIGGILSSPDHSTAYIFILADQPLIGGKLVLEMMNEFEKTKADILYPEYLGRRGNPVIINSKLHNQLLLSKGDSGAKFLFSDSTLHIVSWPVNTDAVITDVDTPEDYRNICNHPLLYEIR
jgi:molybdenum cofactor cytidylyltransferase